MPRSLRARGAFLSGKRRPACRHEAHVWRSRHVLGRPTPTRTPGDRRAAAAVGGREHPRQPAGGGVRAEDPFVREPTARRLAREHPKSWGMAGGPGSGSVGCREAIHRFSCVGSARRHQSDPPFPTVTHHPPGRRGRFRVWNRGTASTPPRDGRRTSRSRRPRVPVPRDPHPSPVRAGHPAVHDLESRPARRVTAVSRTNCGRALPRGADLSRAGQGHRRADLSAW